MELGSSKMIVNNITDVNMMLKRELCHLDAYNDQRILTNYNLDFEPLRNVNRVFLDSTLEIVIDCEQIGIQLLDRFKRGTHSTIRHANRASAIRKVQRACLISMYAV